MIILGLIGMAWVGFGVLSFGYGYNNFQNMFFLIAEEREASDFYGHIAFGLLGPFALLAVLVVGGTDNGLRFRRYKYIDGVRQP